MKNPSDYDKLSNRMSSRGRFTAVVLTTLVCLTATLSCNIATVAGRFTYIVKYEVTTNAPATVDIRYTDENGVLPGLPQVSGLNLDTATPWTYEFPTAFTYTYDSPFYAFLEADVTSLPNLGDKVTVKILWKDYRVDFQEEVLVYGELENTGSPPTDPVQLYSPELPRP